MLQVRFCSGAAPWEVAEDEFLQRIDTWMAERFARVPSGRVAVHATDELGRVIWRAYYPSAPALVALAREIREGRAAALRAETRKPHDQ